MFDWMTTTYTHAVFEQASDLIFELLGLTTHSLPPQLCEMHGIPIIEYVLGIHLPKKRVRTWFCKGIYVTSYIICKGLRLRKAYM